MTFPEAMMELFQKNDMDFLIHHPFFCYAFLSDMTSTSLDGRRLSYVFYQVDSKFHLLESLQRNGAEKTLIDLVPYYQEHRVKIDSEEFKRVIHDVIESRYPQYFEKEKEPSRSPSIVKNAQKSPLHQVRQTSPLSPATKPHLCDLAFHNGYLYFGQYQGDALNWKILQVNTNQIILITEKIIDYLPFDTEKGTDFRTSSLCDWLNGEFYLNSFSTPEKERILTTHLGFFENQVQKVFDTKVFLLTNLLSNDFYGSKERRCEATPYAYEKETKWEYPDGRKKSQYSSYFLVSALPEQIRLIDEQGRFQSLFQNRHNIRCGVRPCIRLRIS